MSTRSPRFCRQSFETKKWSAIKQKKKEQKKERTKQKIDNYE